MAPLRENLAAPLADPFALGISSGASLGVALVVLGSGTAAAAFGASIGIGGDALITAAAIAGAILMVPQKLFLMIGRRN